MTTWPVQIYNHLSELMTIRYLSPLEVFPCTLNPNLSLLIRFIVLLKIVILVIIHRQTSVSVFLALSIARFSVPLHSTPHEAALDSRYTMNYYATCLLKNCYCTCTLPLIPAISYYHLIYIIHRIYSPAHKMVNDSFIFQIIKSEIYIFLINILFT